MSKVVGTALTPTANRVIALAQSQLGYHEGRDKDGNWNNLQKFSGEVPGLAWSNGQAWCATFVSWVALKSSAAALFPSTASTDVAASWYQSRKQWSTYPAVGAQGFLATNGNEFHTFIVASYDDTYVYTVEGNSNTSGSPQGDGVYALTRHRRDAVLEGYGYPNYPEGILSDDPDWADRAPKAVPTSPVKAKPVTHLVRYKVATINLESLPVNADVLGTLTSAPAASVLLVQEADLDQFKHVISSLKNYRTADLKIGDNTYDSFVLYKPAIWEHVSTRFVKSYDGSGAVSYTRHIAVTVLRLKATGTEFTFISWHAVTAGKDKVRKRLRKQGLANVRRVISSQRKTGRPVTVGADDNTPANLHPSAKIHTHHGIDHEHVWDGSSVSIQRVESHTVKTTSDHLSLVVTYAATIK